MALYFYTLSWVAQMNKALKSKYAKFHQPYYNKVDEIMQYKIMNIKL